MKQQVTIVRQQKYDIKFLEKGIFLLELNSNLHLKFIGKSS